MDTLIKLPQNVVIILFINEGEYKYNKRIRFNYPKSITMEWNRNSIVVIDAFENRHEFISDSIIEINITKDC